MTALPGAPAAQTNGHAPVGCPASEIKEEFDGLERAALAVAKSHQAAARRWSWAQILLGIPATILAGLAAASGFADAALVAGISATGSTVLTGLVTMLRPREAAHRNRKAFRELRGFARHVRMTSLCFDFEREGSTGGGAGRMRASDR